MKNMIGVLGKSARGLVVLALLLTATAGEEEPNLSELGRGTYRVFESDSAVDPIAWAWVPAHTGPGVEIREFWITRSTYMGPSQGMASTTLVFKPVTDGTALSLGDYFDFRTWVTQHGKVKDTGVNANQFKAAYSHTVMPIPKELAAPE